MSAMVVSTTGNWSALAGSERATRARTRRRMDSPGGGERAGRWSAKVGRSTHQSQMCPIRDAKRGPTYGVRRTGLLLQLLRRVGFERVLLLLPGALALDLVAPFREPVADFRFLAVRG